MRRPPAVVALLLALVACGNEKQEKKASTSGGSTGSGGGTAAGQALDLKTFELGPYLLAAVPGAGEKQVSLEFGFIDVRQKRSAAQSDIYDYRWRQASLVAAPSHLPAPQVNTCVDASGGGVKTDGTFASEATASGAAAGALAKGADGVFRLDDKAQDSKIDTLKTLTVAVKDGPTVVAPSLPTTGSIQLSGAYDGTITVNTSLKDLNDNLKKFGSQELTVADIGTGKDYDVVVVTFHGSASAQSKVVRCVIAPNGSAALTPALHKAVTPIRAVFGVFANVETKTEGGITVWSAGIAGNGADDFTVP